MDKPIFKLRLVWESLEHSPEWELETEHGHFANWVAPELFAQGFTSPHPRLLELRDGRMFLRLNDGTILELGDDGSVSGTKEPTTSVGLSHVRVIARRLAEIPDDDDVVNCEDYVEIQAAKATDLSRMGLDGEWNPAAYEVWASSPLTSELEIDDTGKNLRARRESDPSSSDESDTPDLILLPRP
jgi:hypothetical protein